MLSEQTAEDGKEPHGHVTGRRRLLMGYVLAVAAGSIVLCTTVATVAAFTGPYPRLTRSLTTELAEFLIIIMLTFLISLVACIPFTAVVSFINRRARLHQRSLLTLGAIAPTLTHVIVATILNGHPPLLRDLPIVLLFTAPAGIVAAYLYGAIGWGYGFGRWRLG